MFSPYLILVQEPPHTPKHNNSTPSGTVYVEALEYREHHDMGGREQFNRLGFPVAVGAVDLWTFSTTLYILPFCVFLLYWDVRVLGAE